MRNLVYCSPFTPCTVLSLKRNGSCYQIIKELMGTEWWEGRFAWSVFVRPKILSACTFEPDREQKLCAPGLNRVGQADNCKAPCTSRPPIKKLYKTA